MPATRTAFRAPRTRAVSLCFGLRVASRVLAALALLTAGTAFTADSESGTTATLAAIKASPVGHKLYVKLHTNGLRPPQFATTVSADARHLQIDLLGVQAGTAFAAPLHATKAGLSHVTVTQLAGERPTTRVTLGLAVPVDRIHYRVLPAGDTGDVVIQFDALTSAPTAATSPARPQPAAAQQPALLPLWDDPLVLTAAALLLGVVVITGLRRLRADNHRGEHAWLAEALRSADALERKGALLSLEQGAPLDLHAAADLLGRRTADESYPESSALDAALRKRFSAEALLTHLRGGPPRDRACAARLLCVHPTEVVADALLRAAASDEGAVRSAAVASLSQLACEPTVHTLLQALAGGDEASRAVAREALQQAGPRGAAALRRELLDPDAALRAQALEALVLIRSGDSGRAVARLLSDPSDHVRLAAARALRALGAAETEGEALRQALDDPSPDVQNEAGLALARVGGPYLAPLAVALERRSAEDISYSASNELLAAMAAAAVQPVAEYVRVLAGLDRGLAQGLAQALERNGNLRAWLSRLPESSAAQQQTALDLIRAAAFAGAVEPVLEGLTLPHAEARAYCLRLLGEVAAPAAVGSLRDLLTDPDEALRVAAVRALGRIGNRGAGDALTGALQDPSPQVRAQAARGLSASFAPRAADGEALQQTVDALLRAARDASADVRAEVARAFGAAGTEPALLALVNLALHDGEEAVRAAALAALADSDGYRAVPAPLLEAVASDDAAVRARALQILSHAEDPAALAAMVTALQDTDGTVRAAAGRGLWEVADGQQWQFLLQYLNSPDPRVRAAVVGVLGKTRSADWAGTLAGAVSDPSPRVRAAIMNALGRMGEAAGLYLHAIMAGLGDSDAFVRARAAEAAPHVAPRYPGMAREVLRLAADSDTSVRASAVTSLMQFARGDLPEALVELIAEANQPEEVTAALAGAEDDLLRRLLEGAKQAPPEVAGPAMRALSPLLRERWTVADLRPKLASLEPEVRLEALDCLALLEQETAIHEVAQLLDADPSPRVRARAARTLNDVCATVPEAWHALQRAAAADPDEIVRGFAEEAIRAIPAPAPSDEE